jgi:hypothetical protein
MGTERGLEHGVTGPVASAVGVAPDQQYERRFSGLRGFGRRVPSLQQYVIRDITEGFAKKGLGLSGESVPTMGKSDTAD